MRLKDLTLAFAIMSAVFFAGYWTIRLWEWRVGEVTAFSKKDARRYGIVCAVVAIVLLIVTAIDGLA